MKERKMEKGAYMSDKEKILNAIQDRMDKLEKWLRELPEEEGKDLKTATCLVLLELGALKYSISNDDLVNLDKYIRELAK